jgi:hypothetical protein
MPGGNAVKIAIVVVGIGIAVTVFALTRKQPTLERINQKQNKDLVCVKCKAHIEMPIEEFEKAITAAPARENTAGADSGPRARSSVNLPKLLKCPKCNEDGLLAAAKCPKSDTWYPVVDADGKKGKCPD